MSQFHRNLMPRVCAKSGQFASFVSLSPFLPVPDQKKTPTPLRILPTIRKETGGEKE